MNLSILKNKINYISVRKASNTSSRPEDLVLAINGSLGEYHIKLPRETKEEYREFIDNIIASLIKLYTIDPKEINSSAPNFMMLYESK